MSAIRLAIAQYAFDELEAFAAYRAKITRWIEDAARAGAQLLVFPEYGSMELSRLAGREIASDLAKSIASMQSVIPDANQVHADLAKQHGLFILGGSAPVRQSDGSYRNTARFFTPSGGSFTQEKLIMTRFERERWHISAGAGQRVFDTPLGKIGIAICYDVEFPLLVRALTEAGAELILAPSCTDAAKGYHRVRVGAQARALENQCIVVQSPTVGDAPWSPAVDSNVGAAGVFGPPDLGFPDDGVIALGAMNAAQWLHAEIDLKRVREVRAAGHVFNHKHWAEQAAAQARIVRC